MKPKLSVPPTYSQMMALVHEAGTLREGLYHQYGFWIEPWGEDEGAYVAFGHVEKEAFCEQFFAMCKAQRGMDLQDVPTPDEVRHLWAVVNSPEAGQDVAIYVSPETEGAFPITLYEL